VNRLGKGVIIAGLALAAFQMGKEAPRLLERLYGPTKDQTRLGGPQEGPVPTINTPGWPDFKGNRQDRPGWNSSTAYKTNIPMKLEVPEAELTVKLNNVLPPTGVNNEDQ
jgi:hypothetical protein